MEIIVNSSFNGQLDITIQSVKCKKKNVVACSSSNVQKHMLEKMHSFVLCGRLMQIQTISNRITEILSRIKQKLRPTFISAKALLALG